MNKVLCFSELFNEDTLNIFTDASIYKDSNGYTISSPGALCVYTQCATTYVLEKDIDERNIIDNSTNNEGEISAIALGVYLAIKYTSKYKHINLFSDSNICIQGLTDWIFNWVKNMDNGIMMNSSGTPVANQSIIASIVNTIIEQKLEINMFHQKGHVKIENQNSLNKANKDFITTNKLNGKVDEDIIKCISFYNDIVDNETRDLLMSYVNSGCFWGDTQKPIVFTPRTSSINDYKKLINKRA